MEFLRINNWTSKNLQKKYFDETKNRNWYDDENLCNLEKKKNHAKKKTLRFTQEEGARNFCNVVGNKGKFSLQKSSEPNKIFRVTEIENLDSQGVLKKSIYTVYSYNGENTWYVMYAAYRKSKTQHSKLTGKGRMEENSIIRNITARQQEQSGKNI